MILSTRIGYFDKTILWHKKRKRKKLQFRSKSTLLPDEQFLIKGEYRRKP